MTLHTQYLTMLLMLGSGFCLGVILDTYRVLKGRFHIRGWAVSLIDLLYWFVCSGLVFSVLFWSNWGELRFYIFLAIILGVFLYYQWLSKFTTRLIEICIRVIEWIIQFHIKAVQVIVIRPILFTIGLIRKLLLFILQLFWKMLQFSLRPLLWLCSPITNRIEPRVRPYMNRGVLLGKKWIEKWRQRKKKDDSE
ncbi:spore cortex biosynthesis protein YabQ [Thermoactinomyces sp. DSM 45891]|uniref:spore cortex biosynthesis protein YabQ n=1 Tax=Thermoactinomyces sp. DSM 45891 TaxID=1761907 RepID=UPI000922A846|nr:spore cortex biosynthesis protein YabQ [Thermoactinomyces sp. DSM 45891]SFX39838.1 spore cortex biosynthesis protein YabQ [Thermoactinomyces sp. DSM 45891]